MPFNNFGVPGTIYTTADLNVSAGRAVRVYFVHEIYGAGAVGSVLRNGTAAGDTAYIQLTSVDSSGVTHQFNEGALFPDGLFYDEGTSVTSALICCHFES
jgi:hypothetical protein